MTRLYAMMKGNLHVLSEEITQTQYLSNGSIYCSVLEKERYLKCSNVVGNNSKKII